jgi:hypothetical protein
MIGENIPVIKTKSNDTISIAARVKSKVYAIEEVMQGRNEGKFSIWESYYKESWYTFIKFKNPSEVPKLKFKVTGGRSLPHVEEEDYIHPEAAKDMEMDAYDYDGDPDKFDEWREGSGY